MRYKNSINIAEGVNVSFKSNFLRIARSAFRDERKIRLMPVSARKQN